MYNELLRFPASVAITGHKKALAISHKGYHEVYSVGDKL
jgi:hypothetical protein